MTDFSGHATVDVFPDRITLTNNDVVVGKLDPINGLVFQRTADENVDKVTLGPDGLFYGTTRVEQAADSPYYYDVDSRTADVRLLSEQVTMLHFTRCGEVVTIRFPDGFVLDTTSTTFADNQFTSLGVVPTGFYPSENGVSMCIPLISGTSDVHGVGVITVLPDHHIVIDGLTVQLADLAAAGKTYSVLSGTMVAFTRS